MNRTFLPFLVPDGSRSAFLFTFRWHSLRSGWKLTERQSFRREQRRAHSKLVKVVTFSNVKASITLVSNSTGNSLRSMEHVPRTPDKAKQKIQTVNTGSSEITNFILRYLNGFHVSRHSFDEQEQINTAFSYILCSVIKQITAGNAYFWRACTFHKL